MNRPGQFPGARQFGPDAREPVRELGGLAKIAAVDRRACLGRQGGGLPLQLALMLGDHRVFGKPDRQVGQQRPGRPIVFPGIVLLHESLGGGAEDLTQLGPLPVTPVQLAEQRQRSVVLLIQIQGPRFLEEELLRRPVQPGQLGVFLFEKLEVVVGLFELLRLDQLPGLGQDHLLEEVHLLDRLPGDLEELPGIIHQSDPQLAHARKRVRQPAIGQIQRLHL